MASRTCWKCLTRPSKFPGVSNQGYISSKCPLVSSFSTSATLYDVNPKSKKVSRQTGPAVKTLRLKKKTPIAKGRPPAPGERKAMRKRIVLSNSNALEVPNMVDMTAELDAAQIGMVVGLQGPLVDQLRVVEAFKTTQRWSLFRRPAVLIREDSVVISKMLNKTQDEKKTSVVIIDGERGSGKSLLLLQAMAMAFLRGWIVVNIPEAQDLTMALTDYSPIANTTPTLYSQNIYTANLLGQIAKANQAILSNLQITQQHTLPIPLQSNISLFRLAELGVRDPDISYPIFLAFWAEITSPSRPPILLSLDGLQHTMKPSTYRSPDYQLIHAHDLALIKHFTDYLSGSKTLANGGVVLAATTKSNCPLSYATNLAIEQKLEKREGKEITKIDPWAKIDMRAYESLQFAELIQLKGLSKAEARRLMEYWAASGVLRQRVDEKTVAEKWALAGHGIVGEIERGVLRLT